MNPPLLLARGPATRAAHALNDTMKEIAADMHELRAQTKLPPLQAEAVGEESRDTGTERDEGISVSEASPPVANETPGAPPGAEVLSGTSAVAVSMPAPTRATPALPPVADLRPELAAFTAAVTQQQQATAQALRQVTELCRNQLVEIKRLSEELGKLDRQLQNLAQRP